MEKFGELSTEKDLKKIQVCRDIVKEIMRFGVTQEQILLIIQLLGYELHNHEHLVEVVALTKALQKNSSILITDKVEEV